MPSPSTSRRAAGTSRSHASHHTFTTGELQQLEIDIMLAHASLDEQYDAATMLALSTLLRRRFFAAGHMHDLQESLALRDAVPMPTLEEIGTASITFRPELHRAEHLWVQWQPWLEAEGYALSPRYSSDWIPSWVTNPEGPAAASRPDHLGTSSQNSNAAVRIADGLPVWLKVCSDDNDDDHEIDARIYFASDPQRSDPRNHCCPLLDILRTPSVDGNRHFLLVMPLLRNVGDGPEPELVRDLTGCILQLAEGLEHMHEHNVAHRDIHLRNIMMDASHHISGGWHPFMRDFMTDARDGYMQRLKILPYFRAPVKYFYINFGLSLQFPSESERGYIVSTGGADRPVPELSNVTPYDPFAADIRMFGDMLRDLQDLYRGLTFLDPLVAQLVPDDPRLRLDAPNMLRELRLLLAKQSPFTLLMPLRRRHASGSHFAAWMRYPFRVLADLRGQFRTLSSHIVSLPGSSRDGGLPSTSLLRSALSRLRQPQKSFSVTSKGHASANLSQRKLVISRPRPLMPTRTQRPLPPSGRLGEARKAVIQHDRLPTR